MYVFCLYFHKNCGIYQLLLLFLLLVLRRSLQIPIPAWAMKATVFSSSGRGPYSFVCMSTLSLQMDCLTLLYSLQSCSTCWAVSAACPHEQRSVNVVYISANSTVFNICFRSPIETDPDCIKPNFSQGSLNPRQIRAKPSLGSFLSKSCP